jgi:hypothetical protein
MQLLAHIATSEQACFAWLCAADTHMWCRTLVAAANQALGRNTFNSRMVSMEEIDEKLEQMKQLIDEQSKQIAALQQGEGVLRPRG